MGGGASKKKPTQVNQPPTQRPIAPSLEQPKRDATLQSRPQTPPSRSPVEEERPRPSPVSRPIASAGTKKNAPGILLASYRYSMFHIYFQFEKRVMMMMNDHWLIVNWENRNLVRQRKLQHQKMKRLIMMNDHRLIISWENQNLVRQQRLQHQVLYHHQINERLRRVRLQQLQVFIQAFIESVHRHTTENLAVTVHTVRIVNGEVMVKIQ